MEIDFSTVEDAEDFGPVPEGKYHIRVVEIEPRITRAGDPMWNLSLEIQQGDHAGRIIWDSMVLSPNGLKRAKLILSRLGVDVSGKVKLTPELIMDREAIVDTAHEEYEDRDGKPRKKSKVTFAGYERYTPGAVVEPGAGTATTGSKPAGNGTVATRAKPLF